MKTISAALAQHLAQDSTTVAMIWKCKRTDGVIIAFTDHDQPITFNDGEEGSPAGTLAVTYLPFDGATGSSTDTSSDMSTSSQELIGYLDSAAITESDIFANKYDYCVIEVRLVNWADLTMGALLWKKGVCGEVTMKNGQFTVELRGLEFYLNTNLGETYGPTCRADLGDARCTFNLSTAIQSAVVVSVSDLRTFVPAAYPLTSPPGPLVQNIGAGADTPAPSGWFDTGVIVWLTGKNAGYQMETGSWDGSEIVLFENMHYVISPGDTFTIEPGCDHTVGTCFTKFNNVVNFIGEPFIPGNEQIMIYPNADGTVPIT